MTVCLKLKFGLTFTLLPLSCFIFEKKKPLDSTGPRLLGVLGGRSTFDTCRLFLSTVLDLHCLVSYSNDGVFAGC